MIASIANRFLDLVQRWGWMLGCVLVAIIFVVSGWGKLMNPQDTAAFMAGGPGLMVEQARGAPFLRSKNVAFLFVPLRCYLRIFDLPPTPALDPSSANL